MRALWRSTRHGGAGSTVAAGLVGIGLPVGLRGRVVNLNGSTSVRGGVDGLINRILQRCCRRVYGIRSPHLSLLRLMVCALDRCWRLLAMSRDFLIQLQRLLDFADAEQKWHRVSLTVRHQLVQVEDARKCPLVCL